MKLQQIPLIPFFFFFFSLFFNLFMKFQQILLDFIYSTVLKLTQEGTDNFNYSTVLKLQ